ncbi:phosphotransferase [Paenibacillus tengchongensis]|uniref:phosphotransferase n=1 Tax=Paenibacillus tengchongensis TaxID=2608684 RepID=UPI00124DDA66|nr:phosphotransferase [Paenibacillus tengchongensis]
MTCARGIPDIVNSLRENGIIDYNTKIHNTMSGSTEGYVHILTVDGVPQYVLKTDDELSISLASQLLQAYSRSPLLAKLIYTDPAKAFLVYSYLAGTTHYNRGPKREWMALIVKHLLNHYSSTPQTEGWGRLEYLHPSWREFNERSLEAARDYAGSVLPTEDYHKVEALIEEVSKVDDKYLLHGDTGVHNFVFNDNGLAGVIDPSPMAGPVIYDFTYAFCSSPDNLDLETLMAAYKWLDHAPLEPSRLIKEVVFQLYCRIGICVRVHPHDLEDYLEAWRYWRLLL